MLIWFFSYLHRGTERMEGTSGAHLLHSSAPGGDYLPPVLCQQFKTSNKWNFTASLDNLFQCQLPLPLESFPDAWAGCPLLPLMNIPSCPICDGKEQEFVTSTPLALTYLRTLCLLQTKQASNSSGPCFQDLWSSLLSSGLWLMAHIPHPA